MSMLANGCFIINLFTCQDNLLSIFRIFCSPSSIGFFLSLDFGRSNNLDNSVSVVCHSVYGWF